MAIAFRNETHTIATSTSPTGTEPTGTVQGDVLVALFIVDAGTTYTAPAGWTTIYSGVSATSSFRYALMYVVRDASAPNLTWTYTGSTYRELFILGFSGCDTTDPIDASSQIPSGNGTVNPDPPVVTAVSSSAMALAIGINWAGSTTGGWGVPSGYTIRTDNTAANDGVIASKLLTVAGAENPGAFSNAVTTAPADYWAAAITLSPLPATTVTTAWLTA